MERENSNEDSTVKDREGGWSKPVRQSSFGGPTLTLADLMDPRVLKGVTDNMLRDLERKKKKQGAARPSEGDLVPIPHVEPPPSLKILGAKLTENEIKSLLQPMAKYGVSPAASVQRDRRDPHFKKGGGLTNLFSYAPTFTAIGKDADVAMSIAQLPLDKFDAETINRARKAVATSNEWITTNAPHRGLLNRVVEGLSRPKPPFKTDDYLQYVIEKFPVNRNALRDLRGQGISDLGWLVIDKNSSSGVPFVRPKVGPTYNDIPQILEISAEILKAVSEGKIQEWAAKNPALQVVLLRNKLDKYLLSEVPKKIRPYFAYPAHWNMLFQAIWQPVAEAAINFLDDPTGKSINAHGFSWARGGAGRLYDWILTRGPGFHAAAYSDDMIWVVVTKDGKRYVILPDFKMMDMSLGARYGELTFRWLCHIMTNHWDNTWKAIGELACRQAFNRLVCVCYALLYFFQNGLGSGIAGTPEYDQVATCAYIGRLEKKFFSDTPADLSDLKQRLEQGVAEGQKYLGLEIKKETLTVHEFLPEEDYPWLIFLGHALRKYVANGRTMYVPVRPYEKIVVSLVSPKGSYGSSGVARIRGMMSRLVGITASGGWFYPELWFAARRIYEVYAVRGTYPADENDMTYSEFCNRDTAIPLRPFNKEQFPTREWFASLVCPVDIVVEAFDEKSADRPKVEISELFKLGGEWGTESWADAQGAPMDSVVLKDRRERDDVGATNMARPALTDNEHLGRVVPLSEEQKRAYRDAARAAMMSRRAMYVHGTAAVHDTERGGKLAKVMKNLDDEFTRLMDETGLEEMESNEAWASGFEYLSDDALDELHRERVAPSMIRGYYNSNE